VTVIGLIDMRLAGSVAAAELAVSYFDPEHYSYRVKLRRRSR